MGAGGRIRQVGLNDECFAAGLAELAEWVARQEATDRVAEARRELELRGLVA